MEFILLEWQYEAHGSMAKCCHTIWLKSTLKWNEMIPLHFSLVTGSAYDISG